MRNDRQAHMALEQQTETKEAKAKRIMQRPEGFAFRLAALNAMDTNPGKMWD